MAYSMLECPKLHNARSLKFYPEEHDHNVSFRHKNLPPDFELTVENCKHPVGENGNYSVQRHKKCPIYIHNFQQVQHDDGDFVKNRNKKSKTKKKSLDMKKLEETYWAHWKPDNDKNSQKIIPFLTKKEPEIEVIKRAPVKKHKIKLYPPPEEKIHSSKISVESKDKIKRISSKSQEIQTEDITKEEPKTTDSHDTQVSNDTSAVTEDISVNNLPEDVPSTVSDEVLDNKFLKHTDSFVLNLKKQKEEKERFDLPKCIRLYRKPGKINSNNFIKGGSYPLKSCLKKDSNLTKGSSRLTRPGSPIITTSNFSSRSRNSKTQRHQHKL